jgi:hypothetical protein
VSGGDLEHVPAGVKEARGPDPRRPVHRHVLEHDAAALEIGGDRVDVTDGHREHEARPTIGIAGLAGVSSSATAGRASRLLVMLPKSNTAEFSSS